MNSTALRATLDAEKNPLRRFKLAVDAMEGWMAADPEGALAWLQSQPVTDRRDEIIRMALRQYAGNDVRGAAAWMMKHLENRELNNAIIMLAENWAEQNGAEAAAWFAGLPATKERDAAIENIMFSWAANEPQAALQFVKAHPELSALYPIMNRAAYAGWAKSNPVGAVNASLASSHADNDPARFANTLANWATIDLETSSQWLIDKVPAGKERLAAASELGVIFAHQSPEAGIEWLAKLQSGSERDGAASSLVATWSNIAPADAAKWAASQTQAVLEAEAITEIAQNYLMRDPNGFQSWRNGLPAGAFKDQVLKTGAAAEE